MIGPKQTKVNGKLKLYTYFEGKRRSAFTHISHETLLFDTTICNIEPPFLFGYGDGAVLRAYGWDDLAESAYGPIFASSCSTTKRGRRSEVRKKSKKKASPQNRELF